MRSTLTAAAARAPAGAPDRVWARLGMRSSARPLWSHTHELVRTAPKLNTTHRPEGDSTASAGSACPDDAEPGGEARLLPERPVRMTQSRNQETGPFVADSFCRICGISSIPIIGFTRDRPGFAHIDGFGWHNARFSRLIVQPSPLTLI